MKKTEKQRLLDYIDNLCEKMGDKEEYESSTAEVLVTLFASTDATKGKIASVNNRPISNSTEVNRQAYRYILERKVKKLEYEKYILQERVNELEEMFEKELKEKELEEMEDCSHCASLEK